MNAVSRRTTLMDIWCSAALALLLAEVVVAGFRSQEDRLSCHVCRGLRSIRTTSFYGVVLSRKESPITNARSSTDHQHPWFKYSYAYWNGPWGWFGGGVACKTDGRYRDEQHPTD